MFMNPAFSACCVDSFYIEAPGKSKVCRNCLRPAKEVFLPRFQPGEHIELLIRRWKDGEIKYEDVEQEISKDANDKFWKFLQERRPAPTDAKESSKEEVE
jgi:hypothetical protein